MCGSIIGPEPVVMLVYASQGVQRRDGATETIVDREPLRDLQPLEEDVLDSCVPSPSEHPQAKQEGR